MFGFLTKIFKRKSFGKRAEDFAADYIKKHTPYKILARNYRYKNYEADIIACQKSENLLVVIEVKARNKTALVSGYNCAVLPSKMRSVNACLKRYMATCEHEFSGVKYCIFEAYRNEHGDIVDFNFHEDIPLRNGLLRGRQI